MSYNEHFRKHGYCVVHGVLSEGELLALEADYAELIEEFAVGLVQRGVILAPTPGEDLGFARRLAAIVEALDDEAWRRELPLLLNAFDCMHVRTRGFFRNMFNSRLLDVVVSLVDPSGNAACPPWHQYQAVAGEETDTAEIVMMWAPLVDVAQDQHGPCDDDISSISAACPEGLQVLPGFPKPGVLLPHVHSERRGMMVDPLVIPEYFEDISCNMRRGDVLLMNTYTPHRGTINRSKAVRWSVDLRFQAVGSSTDRPFWPEVLVHSSLTGVGKVQSDYQEWCAKWEVALASTHGKPWHRTSPLPASVVPIEQRFAIASETAKGLWSSCRPCREVNREMGYPVVVCGEEDGAPVPVSSSLPSETEYRQAEQQKWPALITCQVQQGWLHPVEARSSSTISGTGVFALAPVKIGALVGCYFGTVYSEEEWDALEADKGGDVDDNFLFNINDGAHGAVLDGKVGPGVNALKWLNHSCAPNVVMQEAFLDGCWHVLVLALRDICAGEELAHDFQLHTESEEEAVILCTCRATDCRGTLFRYFAW